jgi:predicted component of type VI protein secretion system
MPKLQISLPDGTQNSFELIEDTITVGRVEDNIIQIDDASVSSHHAELVRDGDDYILRDLDSTNGTRLNGTGHTEGRLKDGDEIMFGKIDAIYESEHSAAAAQAAAQPMPEEAAVAMQPATQSVPPANFANASPFERKEKKKDPVGMAILAFAGVSILVFVLAVVSVFGLKSPL